MVDASQLKPQLILHRKMVMNKFVWLVLLILVSVGKWCCEGCWKEERDGLLHLKAVFSYPQDLIDWVDGTDCCQWERVKCNTTTSRVAQLDLFRLSEYNWHLNFSYFQVFEDLESLDLGDNGIEGCAQAQNLGSDKRASRLKNLQVLDLSDNKLDDTSILSCLCMFSSLKSLDLAYNVLNGKSAHGVHRLLAELTNLEKFDLSGNHFNDSDLFSSLGGLLSLKILALSYNELTLASLHDNEELLWPGNLEELHLNGNYFTNDIVSSFTELHHLKVIDLSGNLLEGSLDISGLNALSKLETLIFNGNRITNLSVLEDNEKLPWPGNLEELYLDGNYFRNDIVSSFNELHHLKVIDLSGNLLEGSLDISGLNALSKLETLIFNGNRITNLSVLEGMSWPTNLKDLQLSGNNFSIVPSLSELQNLKSLDLSDNHLKGSLDISGLNALSKLETLNLSGNNIINLGVYQGTKKQSNIKDLILDSNDIDGSMLQESLQAFSSIRSLSLRYNNFNGTIVAEDFGDLDMLEGLYLGGSSNIGNVFFKSIGALTSLKLLSMYGCGINNFLPDADWSKLIKLEELDLRFNQFKGPLPSSFRNMTSLRKLQLAYNNFIGSIASTLASLTSLEYLDYEENEFEVPASFTSLANHSYIKFIYGKGNKLIPDPDSTSQPWTPKFQLQEFILSSTTECSLPLPNFLFYQYNLTQVDFTDWNFGGEFPSWLLENNTKMTDLSLSNCSIIGHFHLPSHPNIQKIDASNNSISGIIMSKNNSSVFPNLQVLKMSRNKIIGPFLDELGQSKFLEEVDLSNNYFFGNIPSSIFDTSINTFDISHNNFGGKLPNQLGQSKFLETVVLSYNHFSGSIPSSIFDTSIRTFDIGYNNFGGKLPRTKGNSSKLVELYMDGNHFEGSIPIELVKLTSLEYLDLSRNKLSGSIPSLVDTSIEVIQLSNNRLKGFSTRMLNENSSLVLLDFSYNDITGILQDLISNYTKLNFLLLKGNNFIGPIPEQLCQLETLAIVDLSYNNLSGPIPKCLGEIPFQGVKYGLVPCPSQSRYRSCLPKPNKVQEVNFTTKGNSYTYKGSILGYMTGMDLSHNKLDGNIPYELGNLKEIQAINMSYNYLTGEIPATFSNLKQIESLDLSFNKLSGRIPSQLNELNFLAVFSVAHNNFSGPTPPRKDQFMTFDESTYEGNPFLCGPPLPKNCTNYNGDPYAFVPNASHSEGDYDGFLDMQVFYVSFAVAYTMVLLVMAIVLYINPYWRQAWFYFIEFVITNCYYFVEDCFYKLYIIRNM